GRAPAVAGGRRAAPATDSTPAGQTPAEPVCRGPAYRRLNGWLAASKPGSPGSRTRPRTIPCRPDQSSAVIGAPLPPAVAAAARTSSRYGAPAVRVSPTVAASSGHLLEVGDPGGGVRAVALPFLAQPQPSRPVPLRGVHGVPADHLAAGEHHGVGQPQRAVRAAGAGDGAAPDRPAGE